MPKGVFERKPKESAPNIVVPNVPHGTIKQGCQRCGHDKKFHYDGPVPVRDWCNVQDCLCDAYEK